MLLAYYGELDAREQQEFEQHLQADATLAAQYSNFCATMNGVKNAPPQEPSEDFWNALEYNIHAAVRRENAATRVPLAPTEKITWWQSLKELFTPQRIGFTLAGGLVCTLLGVFIGTSMQKNNLQGQDTNAIVQTGDTPSTAASAEQVTNFLRRSQIYFATSVDAEVPCDKCVPIKEQINNKKIAADLLREATLIKKQLQAQPSADPKTKQLLTDIEFVLNNISNNPAINQAQAEEVHHIASNAVCEVAAKIDSTHNNQHK